MTTQHHEETMPVRVSVTAWKALKELQRVTKGKIIFTARVKDHKFAYPYGNIKAALGGWNITKDVGLPSDMAYRILMLEPV